MLESAASMPQAHKSSHHASSKKLPPGTNRLADPPSDQTGVINSAVHGAEMVEELAHLHRGEGAENLQHNPDLMGRIAILGVEGESSSDDSGGSGSGKKKRRQLKAQKDKDDKGAGKGAPNTTGSSGAKETHLHRTMSSTLDVQSMKGRKVVSKPLEVQETGKSDGLMDRWEAQIIARNLKYIWMTMPENEAQKITTAFGRYVSELPKPGESTTDDPVIKLTPEESTLVDKAIGKVKLLDFTFDANRQSYKEKKEVVTVHVESAKQFLAAVENMTINSHTERDVFAELVGKIKEAVDHPSGTEATFKLSPKERVVMNKVTERVLPPKEPFAKEFWRKCFKVYDLVTDFIGGPFAWGRRGLQAATIDLPAAYNEFNKKGWDGVLKDSLASAQLKRDERLNAIKGTRRGKEDEAFNHVKALIEERLGSEA